MAFTEVVISTMKGEEKNIEGFKGVWPTISQVFGSQSAILSRFAGWVVNEDEKEDRNNPKFILVLEWQDSVSLGNFLSSAEFGKFRQGIGPFVAESTGPKLFETDSGPLNSASTVVTEINKIKVSSEAGLKQAENAWEEYVKLVEHHLDGSIHALHGPSTNPDERLYLGMLGWGSLESCQRAHRDAKIRNAMHKLSESGELDTILVNLEAFD